VHAVIERLSGSPAESLGALVTESRRLGLDFLERLVREWDSGANRFDRPGEVLFVARAGGEIIGVCGLNVDPYAADPAVGRVRHLYVLVPYRRVGVGEQLVADVIEAARGHFARLHLRTTNPAAARLYERIGFLPQRATRDCTHALEVPPAVPED
jgi:ribosomal protein S18 acetylase RimI-like enzyme